MKLVKLLKRLITKTQVYIMQSYLEKAGLIKKKKK